MLSPHIEPGLRTMPRYYLIGTKYDRSRDVLPLMLSEGAIATGFANGHDLSTLIGKSNSTLRRSLVALIKNPERGEVETVVKFLGIRPGDLIAIKAHSAPLRTRPRLVVARYAVVRGDDLPEYRISAQIGHAIAVDFLPEQEPLEFLLGYGQTVHEITKPDRVAELFGPYGAAAEAGAVALAHADKNTHQSLVTARSAYMMQRVHNQLQNALRARLEAFFGVIAVEQEINGIDLCVSLQDRFVLIEVKASMCPITCVREAFGQMLHYASHLPAGTPKVEFVVAGPSQPKPQDNSFVEYIRAATGLRIRYCTPATYTP